MAAVTAAALPGSLNLGLVFADAGRILRSKFFTLVGLSLLLGGAPGLIVQTVSSVANAQVHPTLADSAGRALVTLAVLLLGALGWLTQQRIAFDVLTDQRRSLTDAVAAGLRVLVVLVPLTLVTAWWYFVWPFLSPLDAWRSQSLVSFAGFLTDVVLLAFLGMTDMAVIAERRRLIPALGRSVALLRHGRWPLVLFYVLYRAAGVVPRAFLPALLTAVSGGIDAGAWRAAYLASGAPVLVLGVLWTAFSTGYYRQLARLADGAAPAEIAATFD
jgi:hypothetical protein